MDKYIYSVTGDYKDWLEMKRGDAVFHDGSLIGLISCINGKLELKLNYGTDSYYSSVIKKTDDVIITVPTESGLLESDYKYKPLVFDNDEYEELVEISYIDRELLKKVQQVNQQDIYNILLSDFKHKFNISEYLDFSDIISNIITFSEEEDELAVCISNITSNNNINLQRLVEKDSKSITVYVDISGNLCEWEAVLKIDDKFYFKIVDDYVMEM
ncbi:MAG: hypothetical protein PHR92_14350 [Lachnospiraceae bacterium]|nr:hypothetical protein [Lachnospiraceae bacterium]